MKRFASDHHHSLQHEGGFISHSVCSAILFDAADDIQVSTSPSSKFSTVRRCYMLVQYSEDTEGAGLMYTVCFKSEKTGLHSEVSWLWRFWIIPDEDSSFFCSPSPEPLLHVQKY